MTATIDYNEIKEELAVFLRNSNVYSVADRNVTTTTATGSLVASATITIALPNVKNIRSVTIGATAFTFGSQYTVNYNLNGTCVITLYAVQTDTYSVVYDYGTDKIFTDLPRNDLTLSSFPRIAIEMIGDNSDDIELSGSTKQSNISFAIYVFDFKVNSIDATLKTIREKFLVAQDSFYYLGYLKRVKTSNLLVWSVYGNTKIMFKTMDYISGFNYEYI